MDTDRLLLKLFIAEAEPEAMHPARVPFLFTLILLCAVLAVLRSMQPPEQLVAMPAALPGAERSVCEKWRVPDLLDENWSQIDFASACVAHEKCWATAGSSWASCNRDYLDDLRAACVQSVKSDPSENDESPTLALCFDIASQFHARVQRPAALKRFQNAQVIAEAVEKTADETESGSLLGSTQETHRDSAGTRPQVPERDLAQSPMLTCSRGKC